MKLLSYILTFLVSISIFSSCSEEFRPVSEEVEREAVILAELEVGKLVELTISSTFSPSEEPIFPNEEQLSNNLPTLTNLTDGTADSQTLRYQSMTQKWVNQSFQFSAGHTISLSAELAELGLNSVFATTTPPFPGEITAHSERVIDTGDSYEFSIELSIPESEESYYHLLPFEAVSSDSSDKNYFDFSINSIGESSIFRLAHLDGILIDIDRIDNMRQFDFSINKSELSYNPSNINLKVKTVAKEFYDYHRSLSAQLTSSQGPFEQPVPTVSNIERGQGLFTAYTVTLDSILVE